MGQSALSLGRAVAYEAAGVSLAQTTRNEMRQSTLDGRPPAAAHPQRPDRP
jgi:hypothetical protein